MKTLILGLVATVALATATTASAHHNPGREHARVSFDFHAFNRGMEHGLKLGFWAHRGTVAVLSGTGTSFGGTNPSANGSIVGGNDHQNGHFTLGLNTDWSAAQTRTWTDDDGDADDGVVTVSCAPSTATITLTNGSTSNYTLSGKTCQRTQDGTSTYGFVGETSDGATKAFVKEAADGTVKGAVFTRSADEAGLFFGLRDSGRSGHCDH